MNESLTKKEETMIKKLYARLWSANLQNPSISKISNRSTSQSGFTLIEMMIVISIIALVMGFAITNLIRKYDQARVDATKIQMRQLGIVLDDFRRVCGRYPTTPENLDALIKAPSGLQCKNYDPEGFLRDKKLPQDAWGRDFLYDSDGSKYQIKSLGADGKEGGEGFNKDIVSDDL
jgi:general secretion pathway protein G